MKAYIPKLGTCATIPAYRVPYRLHWETLRQSPICTGSFEHLVITTFQAFSDYFFRRLEYMTKVSGSLPSQLGKLKLLKTLYHIHNQHCAYIGVRCLFIIEFAF